MTAQPIQRFRVPPTLSELLDRLPPELRATGVQVAECAMRTASMIANEAALNATLLTTTAQLESRSTTTPDPNVCLCRMDGVTVDMSECPIHKETQSDNSNT